MLQIRGTFGFWNKPKPKDDDDDDDDDDNPSSRHKRLLNKLHSIKDSMKKDSVQTADSVSVDSTNTNVADSVKTTVADSVSANVADSVKVNVTDSAKLDSSAVKDSLATDSAKAIQDTASAPPQPANKPEESESVKQPENKPEQPAQPAPAENVKSKGD